MANCHNCERLVICPWANPEEIICSSFKPKHITNADLIRVMTDEEVARFLGVSDACPPSHPKCEHECYLCWPDWLRRGVEPDD